MDAETFRTGKNPDGTPVAAAPFLEAQDKDAEIARLQAKLDALALVPDRTIVAQIGKDRFVVRMIAHGALSWGDMDRAGLAELVRQAELVLSGKQNWAGPSDAPKEPG